MACVGTRNLQSGESVGDCAGPSPDFEARGAFLLRIVKVTASPEIISRPKQSVFVSMDDRLEPYVIFDSEMESGLNPVGRAIWYHTATRNDLQPPKLAPTKENVP